MLMCSPSQCSIMMPTVYFQHTFQGAGFLGFRVSHKSKTSACMHHAALTSAMLKRCMRERSALGSCEMISLTIQSATRGTPLHNKGNNGLEFRV